MKFREFAKVAELILSPASLARELTDEECLLIASYVNDLVAARHPWRRFVHSAMGQDTVSHFPHRGEAET